MTGLYDAFSEGLRARKEGKPALSNPYDREADKAKANAWISGWMTEDRWQAKEDR